jgi:hypothetical protein
LGGLPSRKEILLFLYIPIFPWRKEKEKLFMYVEVPKLWVPFEVWEYTLGWPSLKGEEIFLLLYVLVFPAM